MLATLFMEFAYFSLQDLAFNPTQMHFICGIINVSSRKKIHLYYQ